MSRLLQSSHRTDNIIHKPALPSFWRRPESRHFFSNLLINILILASGYANADEVQKFNSGIEQNTLIELYTSEGCSSCPPAEKYLNSLKNQPGLWHNIIPLAFHVDYWDYIGWKDRYAQPQFQQRQNRYARQRNLNTIYTPAFVVNGQAWRRYFFNSTPALTNQQTGVLKVSLNKKKLQAEFYPVVQSTDNYVLNIAVLGMELGTQIKAGERKGNYAAHEFVVLGFKSVSSNNQRWQTQLPELHYSSVSKFALAVWVNSPTDLSPVQATGGYINY